AKQIFEEGYWEGEAIQERKDGKEIFVLNATTLVKDDNGNPIGTVKVNRNISERKKIQLELEAAEIRFRTTFEQSPDIIIILDPETQKAVEFNDAVCELLGYTREEFANLHVSDYDAIENPEEAKTHIENILKNGSEDFETKFLTKNGEIKDIFARVKVIELNGQKYFQSIARDITERKKKEEEIRLQSEIMTSLSEGAYLVRLDDGIIVYTNPRFEEMFGYNPGEMIGKNVAIVNAPTDKTPEETKDKIMKVLSETGEWHGEVLNIKKDGTPFWSFANVSVFDHSEHGKVLVSVHTNITERKKTEKIISDLAKFPSENPSPVLRVTKDRVIYANQSAQELFNTYNGEILPDLLRQSVNNVINENLARNLELTLQNRVYSFAITPIEDENYANIYGRDITKQKKAIKKIEDLARFPSENPNPVFRATKDHVIYANQACEEVFHICRGEILPQLFGGIVNEALNKKLAKIIEIEHDKRNYSISTNPIIDENYVNIYVMDITERKKAENILRANQEKFSALFNNANDAIALIAVTEDNKLGQFIEVNNTYIERYGYSRDEFLKLTPQDIDDPILYDKIPGLMKDFLKDGHGTFYMTHVTKEGLKIPVEISSHIFDLKGKKVVISISRDITERKRAEQELKESEHNLGERVKELNCLYGISRIGEKPSVTFNEIIQGTLDLIPPAWQFPEVICARIIYNEKEYKTGNFYETKWKLESQV
ncbi:hypothetical protein LCGC14_2040790, partial [marine sediment metagenome]